MIWDHERTPLSRRVFLKASAATLGARMIPARAQQAQPTWVFGGCYTARGRGIYTFRLDPATGRLTETSVATGELNPSFLAIHPDGRHLYACNEIGNYENRQSGSISAFAIDPATGVLTLMNRQPSEGRNPAHISVDPTGRFVLAANYTGGNVSVLPIRGDGSLGPPADVVNHTGTLGPNTGRQEAPHAHMILPDLSGRWVLANDLGLDQTVIYRVDLATGKLSTADPPFAAAEPGGGPRHLAFHQNGRFVFVLNELTSRVAAFAWDPERGSMRRLQTISTLPEGYAGINTTAQILVAPSRRTLYASNRGHDSIAIFSINPETGELTARGRVWTMGETPRNFNIDPSGAFMHVAHQNTDNIVTFRIDPQNGELTPTGDFIQAGQPVCLVYLPPAEPGNMARAGVTFTANPQPALAADAAGRGWTTLAWNAPDAKELEIRANAPDGVNLGRHGSYGTLVTGPWVGNGMTFFLQDVSDGKPLTEANTLGTVRVRVRN